MKVIIFSENRRDKKSFLCFHGFILDFISSILCFLRLIVSMNCRIGLPVLFEMQFQLFSGDESILLFQKSIQT